MGQWEFTKWGLHVMRKWVHMHCVHRRLAMTNLHTMRAAYVYTDNVVELEFDFTSNGDLLHLK